MFSHWSRPQLGLAPHAVQEEVHRKQNLATRGCVIASYCVDKSCCPYDDDHQIHDIHYDDDQHCDNNDEKKSPLQ